MQFSGEMRKAFCCCSCIGKNEWTISMRLPLFVLADIYGISELKEGSRFSCNFYKVCETEGVKRHYASFAPVRSETPDFHRPQDFTEAVIREEIRDGLQCHAEWIKI